MKVTANFFGPVKSATVDVHPLTIFIGPNNTGKSFIAMLIYAIIDSSILPTFYRPSADQTLAVRTAEVSKFIENCRESGTLSLSIAPESLKHLVKQTIEDLLEDYGRRLVAAIEKAFDTSLRGLANSQNRDGFELTIRHGYPVWELSIRLDGRKPIIRINHQIDAALLDTVFIADSNAEEPLLELLASTEYWLFRECGWHALYLPAARSGILQSHKTLASALVSKSPRAGVEQMPIQKLPGVISDFISAILLLDKRNRTPFAGVAKQLEKNVLKGHVVIRGGEQFTYPELYYSSENSKVPLGRASSMISEIAPIVLLLRHLVIPYNTMIIEEPESHLHPEMQRAMAQAIVELVNKNLRLVITTHSDYLLTQINNYILASAMNAKEQRSLGYSRSVLLNPNAVAAYLFSAHADWTDVTPLDVNPRVGISEESFSTVAESLYNESVELRRKLQD